MVKQAARHIYENEMRSVLAHMITWSRSTQPVLVPISSHCNNAVSWMTRQAGNRGL